MQKSTLMLVLGFALIAAAACQPKRPSHVIKNDPKTHKTAAQIAEEKGDKSCTRHSVLTFIPTYKYDFSNACVD